MGTDIYFKMSKVETDDRETEYPKELKEVVEQAISSGGRPSVCVEHTYVVASWWNNEALGNWLASHFLDGYSSNQDFLIDKSDLLDLISDIDEALSDPDKMKEHFNLEECYDDLEGLEYLIEEIFAVLDEDGDYSLFCHVSC